MLTWLWHECWLCRECRRVVCRWISWKWRSGRRTKSRIWMWQAMEICSGSFGSGLEARIVFGLHWPIPARAAAVVVGRGGRDHKVAALVAVTGADTVLARESSVILPIPLALSRRDSTSASRPVRGQASGWQHCGFGLFPASDRFRLDIVCQTTGRDQGQCGGEQEVAFSWLCSARPRSKNSHKHNAMVRFWHIICCRVQQWNSPPYEFPIGGTILCILALGAGHVAAAGKGSRSGLCNLPQQGRRGFLVVHIRGRELLRCCRGLRGLLVLAHAWLHGEPQGIGARPALKRP